MYVWKKHHCDLPFKPEERILLGLLLLGILKRAGRRRWEAAAVGPTPFSGGWVPGSEAPASAYTLSSWLHAGKSPSLKMLAAESCVGAAPAGFRSSVPFFPSSVEPLSFRWLKGHQGFDGRGGCILEAVITAPSWSQCVQDGGREINELGQGEPEP